MNTIYKLNGAIVMNISQGIVIGEGDDAIHIPDVFRCRDQWAEWGLVEETIEHEHEPNGRFWIFTPNGDGTYNKEPRDIEAIRNWLTDEVKRMRQAALDAFTRSAGVAAVYDENLRAAQLLLAGQGAALLRGEITAEAYLLQMGAGMGLPPSQFAGFIVEQNDDAATKAREIESEYVRLAYSFIPACTFEQAQTVVDDYIAFCAARPAI